MAGDTRQEASAKAAALSDTSHTAAAQDMKHEDYRVPIAPTANANALPAGGLNTAGGKLKEAGFIDGLKTVHLSDIREIHKKPCVRDALMTGIGAGFGIGGLRAVLGGASCCCGDWS